MAAALEFTWDSRDLAVWRGRMVDGALARAVRLAGNQAIRGARKEVSSFAQARKNLGKSVVEEDLTVLLPRRAKELQDFAWTLYIRGKPVPVSRFPHLDTRFRRSGNGVLARFGTGGSSRITSAFVATMASGHLGVFRRRGKARYPIDEVFSSRLPKGIGDDQYLTSVGGNAFRKLETAWKRGMLREIGKLRRNGQA